MADFIKTNPNPFPEVDSQEVELPLGSGTGDHTAVYQNFHRAIQTGSPIRADGSEGRMSLELANAMIYSSDTGQEVTLPLDRQAYAALLQTLQA